MSRTGTALLLSIAAFALAQPSFAQEPQKAYRFELTPFAGFRVGGDFEEMDGDGELDVDDSSAFGIMLNGPAGREWPDGLWEFIYARQQTEASTLNLIPEDPRLDMDIEYFQFGGIYLFDRDNVRPFIAMTLGMSRFDPGTGGYDAENFFSASFGAGVQLNALKQFGFRLEARAYTTFIDSDSEFFCYSDLGIGGCLIQVESSVLTQWEARAGLVYRF